jgi:hypothetical protein
MKKCKECNISKELEDFRKSGKYYRPRCRECERFIKKLTRKKEDPEKVRKRNIKYYQENKKKIRDQQREYYSCNKDGIKNKAKQYYEDNTKT